MHLAIHPTLPTKDIVKFHQNHHRQSETNPQRLRINHTYKETKTNVN